jgi:hypothetical protein
MQKLGGFFDKFRGKVADQIQGVFLVSEIIKKHTAIELTLKQISISGGVLRLKVSPLQKNVIFIKKTALLKEIQEKIRTPKIVDIQY